MALRDEDGVAVVAVVVLVDGGATAAAKPPPVVVGSGGIEAAVGSTHEAGPAAVEPQRRKMEGVPSRDVQTAGASRPICVIWRTSADAGGV